MHGGLGNLLELYPQEKENMSTVGPKLLIEKKIAKPYVLEVADVFVGGWSAGDLRA